MATPPADPQYLPALRRELAGKTGADRDAILAEIKRVGGQVPEVSPRKDGKS